MGHLRLVYSAPAPRTFAHPCLEAFQGELDFIIQTLRWLAGPGDDVEELAYEVFLSLHRDWDDDDGPSQLRPYLFGAAYRVVFERRRRNRANLPAPTIPIGAGRAGRGPRAQDRNAVLQSALESLPLVRRAVFILHDVDGVAIAEVAKTLTVSALLTRLRLRSARRTLAAALRRMAKARSSSTHDLPLAAGGLDPDLAPLLASAKIIPREPEAARARMVARARAAVTTRAAFAPAPSGARHRGLYLVVAACLAFVVGAAAAAAVVGGSNRAMETAASLEPQP